MRCVRRPRDVAIDLRRRDPIRQEGESHRIGIARLRLQFLEGDRAPVQPWRGSGFKAPHGEARRLQPLAELDRGFLAGPTGRIGSLAEMDQAAQEGSRRHHDRSGGQRPAIDGRYASDSISVQQEIRRLAFDDRDTRFLRQQLRHRLPVELAVGLRARSPHRRPLAPVQKPELDARRIGRPAHHAVESVDLADEVTLAKSADCRIARHDAQIVPAQGQQCRLRAHPRRARGRFAARMPTADHDDVELLQVRAHAPPLQWPLPMRKAVRPIIHVKHMPTNARRRFHVKRSLSDTEVPEYHVENVLHVHPAHDAPESACRLPQILGHHVRRVLVATDADPGEGVPGHAEFPPVARPGDRRIRSGFESSPEMPRQRR